MKSLSSASWADLTPGAQAAIKRLCDADHLTFTSVHFREVMGSPFRKGAHHAVIGKTLDRVLACEPGFNRIIISVPPGYTKTEECVIAFIARGLAKNPKARFIHASFSGELVHENSVRIKDVIASEPYQGMWPLEFKVDQSAKGLWRTKNGGGLLAKPAGGPITGFRAGTMDEGFTGALVIDDPLKPDDALRPKKRTNVNDRWHSTFKSRLAVESVPVIVIMQRLHTDDFAGFLLRGGAGCKWHHLMLPIWIDNSVPYPKEFTHGIPIPHGLPDGPLWTAKHTATDIELLKADEYTFASQYMQRPIALGGNVFKSKWVRTYRLEDLPALQWRAIFADTAQKDGERNDYSVFQCWGLGVDGRAYLLDQIRGKWEAPDLRENAQIFWRKHFGAPVNTHGTLRGMYVEDKSSGTGLIQDLAGEIPIIAVQRDKDKYRRALDVVNYWHNGMVYVPEDEPWFPDWLYEVLQFTGQGDEHDDQVDPMVDAVKELLAGGIAYHAWA